MWRKARALERLGRPEEALAAYDAVSARFAGTTDGRTGEVVVMALADRVASLLALDRPEPAAVAAEEARAAYDRHVAAGGEAPHEPPPLMVRAPPNHARAGGGGGR